MHPLLSDDNDGLTRFKREASVDEKYHKEGYESTSEFWKSEAQRKLKEQLRKKLNENVAKNVIMFLGDGMSTTTVTASRIYFGQKLGFTGEESELSFEKFPHTGFSKVINCDHLSETFNIFINYLNVTAILFSSDLLL